MATLLIPGGLPGRSRTIVVPAGGSLDGLVWPAKDVTEIQPGIVDLSGMLAELGLWVIAVDGLVSDPSLTVALVQFTPLGVIQLQIGGGSLATPVPAVAMNVELSGGARLRLYVVQPIEDRSQAGGAAGSVSVSSNSTVPNSGAASLSFLAGTAVTGHRALMFDGSGHVVPADPTSLTYNFVGVSLQAAAAGQPVLVAVIGQQVTEPSWSWMPGVALFVAAGGVITPGAPSSGVVQQIGQALTVTSMLVQPFAPITLV